jgi:putative endonuclease
MRLSGETGRQGESLAAEYYRARGFDILETNWRYSYYEIDLVAAKGPLLHIVEVKTRYTGAYGRPEESVSPLKLHRLMKAAARYMGLHPGWKYVEYDVLSINLQAGKPPEYFLIEDVYE